jgi:NAD(P)H-hydrate epimerase
MQRIDETAIRTLGIPRLLLMDAAGRATANAVMTLVKHPAPVLVCCGLGYNGGDGLCAAWYLSRRAYHPHVVLAGSRAGLKDEPATFATILEHQGIRIHEVTDESQLDQLRLPADEVAAVVDALLGIGLSGPVRPLQARLIAWMNGLGKPIVSADVPSGLDADRGVPMPVAIRARLTVTFGAPKPGLLKAEGPSYAGNIIVDDIGLPAQLLPGVG